MAVAGISGDGEGEGNAVIGEVGCGEKARAESTGLFGPAKLNFVQLRGS